jgi:hypothetical protein
MTTALAIVGAITVILGAAAKIPPAVCLLIRAVIPVATAFRELCHAIRPDRDEVNDSHGDAQPPS